MRVPADLPQWDEAVIKAYRLQRLEIRHGEHMVRLFRARGGKIIANAPYLEYGGLAAASDTPQVLADELIELMTQHGAQTLLLKSREQLDISGTPFVGSENYVTFELDLSGGPDDLWENHLNAKTRNQTRKADKAGFSRSLGGAELLDDFYQVLSRCWRDLGTPTHKKQFFEQIHTAFADACSFIVVYDSGRPVATALLLVLDGALHHPFAGTLNHYKPTSVNNWMYWEIMKFACSNGLKMFEMGRADTEAGTFRFKKSWGAEPIPLHYYYLLNRGASVPDLNSPFYRCATASWRHLPLAIARRAGPALIRYVL
ncbi:MAG: GNAT family N-acetyltransferase [Pseudomonadota bacterium]